MTRSWTRPGVAGVLAAVVVVWLVRAIGVVLTQGSGPDVVTVPSLLLLYAAGPAVLCAVPLVLLARGVLSRLGRSSAAYTTLGLVGGVVVGVVQVGVLLSAWPWEPGGEVVRDLVGLPALGGAVGGWVAGRVARGVVRPSSGSRPAAGRPTG